MSGDCFSPLAGACLRPLGHLSGTGLIQGESLEAQGLLCPTPNFPQTASLQVRAEPWGNKRSTRCGMRTNLVQCRSRRVPSLTLHRR